MNRSHSRPEDGKVSARISRRRALMSMLAAAGGFCPAAADTNPPVRFAISESLVSDVNINDARAAMLVWVKRMMVDLNVVVELTPRVFDTTEEVIRKARAGLFDSVALNMPEYHQICEFLDPSQILTEGGDLGTEQYFLLCRRNNDFKQLKDLRGRRLCISNEHRMCMAPPWLSTILDEAHLGSAEQFFGSVTQETKLARVVLPVFFGQSDAAIASRRGFDAMCELNPQVARDLVIVASSPPMVVSLYVFHRNYHSSSRQQFVRAISQVRTSPAGRQMATLFQFDSLAVKDASSLTTALAVLDKARLIRNRQGGRRNP
ncbi:MAG TPA: PhnD/SsuA/transferrin family substrate-binding protein [Verrucomicrobiae bacterium]|nr:PhnD/SsuA/transferrin family substrate-binding protein [Verrucomicrobiae bacterium]